MVKGLDYAFSHPNLPCIREQGYVFVARYIGDPDPNPLKYLDNAEVKALRTLGLSIVVVRETTAGFMLTDKGAVHARASRAHCDALGLTGIPIYYALDVDPRNLSAAEKNAVTRFLQDAAAADGGGHNVGLYGSDDAIDLWVGTDYCHWGWQTFAWSGGRISTKAHFRQYRNGVALCDGTVDLNETYADDFGQWPRPTPQEDTLSADDVKLINEHATAEANRVIEEIRSTLPYFACDYERAEQLGEDIVWLVSTRNGSLAKEVVPQPGDTPEEQEAPGKAILFDLLNDEDASQPNPVCNGTWPNNGYPRAWDRRKKYLDQLRTVGPVPTGWEVTASTDAGQP